MRNAHAPERQPAADYGTYGADYRFGPIEEAVDTGLRQLCARWNELRGERMMPTRGELNPFALRGMLKFAQLFDVIDGGRDFRVRVMGSGLTEQSGLQLTGKCVSEFENASLRTRIHTALWRVCETKEPVRLDAPHSSLTHLAHRQLEAVCLPLGEDNSVTQVIAGVKYGKVPHG